MKIAVLGAHDARNAGDQAIVHAQIAWLKHHFPGDEILVFSDNWKSNREAFGEQSIESVLSIPPGGNPVRRLVQPLIDFGRYVFPAGHPMKMREFNECGFITLGGSQLLSSQNSMLSLNLARHCVTGILAARTGRPVLQFPQSFGPVSRPDEQLVRLLCRAIPFLSPCDEESLNYLTRLGYASKATLIPDIGIALRQLCPDWFQENLPRRGLGIAPMHSGIAGTEYLQKLAELALNFHGRTGEPVTVFTQASQPGSAAVIHELEDMLTRRGIRPGVASGLSDAGDYLNRYQRCRVLVGCRTDACLFSLVSGTPTLAIAHQPECRGLFKLLGLEEWVVPVESFDPGWALERLTRMHESGEELSARTRYAVDWTAGETLARLDGQLAALRSRYRFYGRQVEAESAPILDADVGCVTRGVAQTPAGAGEQEDVAHSS